MSFQTKGVTVLAASFNRITGYELSYSTSVFFMPSLQSKSFPVAFSNCGTIQTPQLKTEVALPSLQSACLGFTWLVWVARCFFPAECATQVIRILDMVMVFKVSRSICKFRYSNHLPRHLQRKSGSTKTLENTSLP